MLFNDKNWWITHLIFDVEGFGHGLFNDMQKKIILPFINYIFLSINYFKFYPLNKRCEFCENCVIPTNLMLLTKCGEIRNVFTNLTKWFCWRIDCQLKTVRPILIDTFMWQSIRVKCLPCCKTHLSCCLMNLLSTELAMELNDACIFLRERFQCIVECISNGW